MANTAPIMSREDTCTAVRELYPKIIADDAMSSRYIETFKNLVFPVPDPAYFSAGLTAEELRKVREKVLQSTLEDLSSGGNPLLGSNPRLRHNLEIDYRVLQLLPPLSNRDKTDDLLTYATLCLAVDRCREAQDLFQTLAAMLPWDNFFVQSARTFESSCVSLPRFRLNFVSRCQNGWNAVYNLTRSFQSGDLDLMSFQAMARNTFALWTDLPLDVIYIPGRTSTFALSPLEWRQDFIPLQTALTIGDQELPDDLVRRWNVGLLSRPVGDPDKPGKPFFPPDSIQTIAEDTPDHTGIRLQLYHPFMATEPADTNLHRLFSNEVSGLLGTPDFCLLIHSVALLKEPPQSSTGTLETLPQQLEALGYTLEHDIDEVEPLRLHRTYTRQPKEDSDLALRDDITQGDTVCWPLQEEYESYDTTAMDRFMDRGIAPVFLAWPRSIMDCDEETFTQRLQDAIEKNAHGSAKVLGRASGTQFCYLDLLSWTTIPLVSAAEKFFSRIPGGDAVRIQSFYYDATPCPVSSQYIKSTTAIQTAGLPFPLETAVSAAAPFSKGSQPNRPKAKKKNAAKAKRKHSKKFH